MKYAFMWANREEFELKRMCRVLRGSRSGYYDWARREESKRSPEDRALLKEIGKIHQETKEAYGATKTWQALKRSGTACGKRLGYAVRLRSKRGAGANSDWLTRPAIRPRQR